MKKLSYENMNKTRPPSNHNEQERGFAAEKPRKKNPIVKSIILWLIFNLIDIQE